MEMLSGAKKVFTFLREIFVREAGGKKASKVVDDSRGKFWWIVRGSLEGVVNPGFCCISHPPTSHSHILAALRQQVNSFAQSDLIFGRGVFLRFFLAEETLEL